MFAVTYTWRVVPSELEKVLSMAPALTENLPQQRGFQSIALYVNRAESTLLIIAHWATLEDLEADQPQHAQVVKNLASVVTEAQPEIYEVVNL